MAGKSVMPLFYESGATARAVPGRASVSRAKALAMRPSTAVLRVPERPSAQLAYLFPGGSPQIFVHEGARQALERRLTAAYPGPVVLSITDNRHSIISHRLESGVLRARIHHMFLDAPRGVVDALVRYVVRGEREASYLVGDFIEANGSRVVKRRRRLHLHTEGQHHDLLAIFDELNAKYFGGSVNALVTWGKRASRKANRGKARSSIKLGSYTAAERLIRVHPVLDRAWVPRYFVAFVLYHEMLHHVLPSSRGEGRALLHPPAFRDRERQFRHYERALAWERQHIGRLLRS